LDIDDLIKQVKQKAEQLEKEQPQEFQSVVLNTLTVPKEDESTEFKSFHRDDFLVYDSHKFLTMAYEVILKRKPDQVGLENSLLYLNKGGSKQAVLADMMLSEEGIKYEVPIAGMQWPLFRNKLIKKLGYLGRMLKPLLVLPDHIFKLRMTPTLRKLLEVEKHNLRDQRFVSKELYTIRQENQRHYDVLKHQYDTSLKHNEQILQQLIQQNQYLENSLAEVRMQFNYQQRNQDAFLQALINHGAEDEANSTDVKPLLEEHEDDKLDAYYVAFEDACRGTRKEIRKNLSEYLPYIRRTIEMLELPESETPIITDLGCGRGEWLELINEQGWLGKGLDLNKVMVQDCQAKDLEVSEGDVIAYLSKQEKNSLTAVTAFHIIEHLPFSSLLALYEEAIRVLKPGGMIIFETPNPENVLVGSHTFYHDPTHRNPITPTSAQFLARYTGFAKIDILRLHPYPAEAKVPGDEPVVERLNGHLCGPQDYALIAFKPV